MSDIDGKWRMMSFSNWEAFHEAIKTPEPFKEKIKALDEASQKDPGANFHELIIDIQEKKLQRKIVSKGETIIVIDIKIGEEQDMTAPDGRVSKGKCNLVDDKTITFQNKGEDFEIDGKMEAEGDSLIIKMTANGVTGIQKFSRI